MAHVSEKQKNMLLEFLNSHSDLKSGKFTNEFTAKKAQALWQEVANSLNSVPNGAQKDWRKWRRCWQDLKKHAKSKRSASQRYSCGTGGGPPPKDLTPTEIEIIDMIPEKQLEGLGDIAKSGASFCFEEDCENESKPQQKISESVVDKENVEIIDMALEDENVIQIDSENNLEIPGPSSDHSYCVKEFEKKINKRVCKTKRLETSLHLTNSYVNETKKRNEQIQSYHSFKSVNNLMNTKQKYRKMKMSSSWWRQLS